MTDVWSNPPSAARDEKKVAAQTLLDRLFPLLLLGVCNGASHTPSIEMLSESSL